MPSVTRQNPDKAPPDLAEFAEELIEAAEQSRRLMNHFVEHQLHGGARPLDPLNIAGVFQTFLTRLLYDPRLLMEAQFNFWQGHFDLWRTITRRMAGEEVTPIIEPELGDKRFRHREWETNLLFDFIKQSYLLTARWLEGIVADTEGLDDKTRRKLDFYTEQFANALAPTNFLITNPEVIEATIRERGQNLVRGLKNILDDLDRGKGVLDIRKTDISAFEVGINLATTPGKVIYQNEVMQLIQYMPTTELVYERPLLMIPAWINKYYILDLTQDKSMVRWLLDRGYTLFVVSWINPDESHEPLTFEDYMRSGVLDALRAIEQATGETSVNAVGYCIGGTLLGATLAYMAATGDERIASATFFASQQDFSEAGDLEVFIDDAQLKAVEAWMKAQGGYLPGDAMAWAFDLLRSNDLIWSYVIQNYLLGKAPLPFDLLYWNSDMTRMPATMHMFYLREFYQKNALAEGAMVLGGQRLDLGKVTIPVYLQASRDDHIAPYRSVFKATRLFAGPVRFIIAGSGHIAGVINPPQTGKYPYWTSTETADTIEAWWASADEHSGSWWLDWEAWLAPLSGRKIPARYPGDGALAPVEDAPGSYVRQPAR